MEAVFFSNSSNKNTDVCRQLHELCEQCDEDVLSVSCLLSVGVEAYLVPAVDDMETLFRVMAGDGRTKGGVGKDTDLEEELI